MQLVDIKSRDKTPITINLRMKEFGATPELAGRTMIRTLEKKDKKSGEIRALNVEMKFPPAVRWPAGGTIKGLPVGVLDHPVIKSLLARRPGRRPKLVVVRQYEPEAPAKKVKAKASTPPSEDKPKPSAKKQAKKTSRSASK